MRLQEQFILYIRLVRNIALGIYGYLSIHPHFCQLMSLACELLQPFCKTDILVWISIFFSIF